MFAAIRDEVLSGQLPADTKLRLAEYGARFGVSLSVVQQAMSRLAEQGLLQANPQRGFSTLPLSVDDLQSLTRARVMIETSTLREAIALGDLEWEAQVVAAHHRLAAFSNHDFVCTSSRLVQAHSDFHLTLLAGSKNQHLIAAASALRDRALIYLHWAREFGDDTQRDVTAEHRRLVDCTIARQPDEAARVLADHIERTAFAVLGYMRAREEKSPPATST